MRNLKHAGDSTCVVGNDKEQKPTSFLHGKLAGNVVLFPAFLQVRVVVGHTLCTATPISLPLRCKLIVSPVNTHSAAMLIKSDKTHL